MKKKKEKLDYREFVSELFEKKSLSKKKKSPQIELEMKLQKIILQKKY